MLDKLEQLKERIFRDSTLYKYEGTRFDLMELINILIEELEKDDD